MEKYILYTNSRWGFTAAVYVLYLLRIAIYGGYWVISYLLGLYVLQNLIQFVTPLGIPTVEEEEEQAAKGEPMVMTDLPTTIK